MLDRTMKTVIERASVGFPVILLTGMRQVGKTTLLESLAGQERRFVSLDNLETRNFARRDPGGFIRHFSPPCIIDEVQYAPELFTYIKIWVDEKRHRQGQGQQQGVNGAFWLTGSQQYHLMKGIQESLAGRVAILDMLGLSCKEMFNRAFESRPFCPSMDIINTGNNAVAKEQELSLGELFTIIWRGSFPEPVAAAINAEGTDTAVDRDTFYRSYLRTYIERDVKDFQGLQDDLGFYDFIRAAAARTGCLLNYADISRDVGIDVKTAKTWMGTLARSGIIKLLEPYSPNVTQRIIKTPKLYFLDTGLAAYLAGWDSPESLLRGAQNGAMLETWVYTEILRSYWHNGKEPLMYFYRDTHQKEVDFIIEKNMTLYPVEVKKTASPGKADFSNFRALKALNKTIGTGAVIDLYPKILPIGEDIITLPAWEI